MNTGRPQNALKLFKEQDFFTHTKTAIVKLRTLEALALHTETLKLANELLKKDPSEPRYYGYQARAALKSGDAKTAVEILEIGLAYTSSK